MNDTPKSDLSVSVNFKLVGAGWADCELCLEGKRFTLSSISYITDAIGDLVRFALMIATGASTATISFDREPAEWRLVATSLFDETTRRGTVSISVYEFPELLPYAPAPISSDALVFVGSADALAFAKAVLVEAQQALTGLGSDGWGYHPYPADALRALDAALSDR